MLIPLILTNEEIDEFNRQQSETTTEEASKTWLIDFDTGEIHAEYIDAGQAVRQSVIKAIRTTRDRYAIYTSDYGSEISALLGKSFSEDYLKLEIPRLIREALMPDDRIESVDNFDIKILGDIVTVSFTVDSTFGELEVKEVQF